MDPGNWATNIAGGSAFGYTLLIVILLSSVTAMFLQYLSLKLGVVSDRDLAQACRDAYHPKVRTFSPSDAHHFFKRSLQGVKLGMDL